MTGLRGGGGWVVCGLAALTLCACSTVAEGTGADAVDSGDTGLSGGTGQQSGPANDDASASLSESASADGTESYEPTGSGVTGEVTATEGGSTSGLPGGETGGTTGFDPQGTDATSAGDTGGGTDDEASTTASDFDTGTGTGTGTDPGCVPQAEVCNDLDDDCNDIVDDVDVGGDGICDCLSIALVGNQGYEPSSEFQAYLEQQGTSVERINSEVLGDIDAALTPAVLAKYDIIILDWLQRNYTPQEAADVKAWVEAGAGLMTMTGHVNNQVTIDRSNSFITPLGLKYNGSKGFFDGPVTQFAPHPITEGLTSITFLGGLYIDVTPDNLGENTTIMTLPQGPVGVVQERVEGRVFVFGDEWVEFDSQWQNMAQIKQFWVQTLAYLGPKDSCIVPQ